MHSPGKGHAVHSTVAAGICHWSYCFFFFFGFNKHINTVASEKVGSISKQGQLLCARSYLYPVSFSFFFFRGAGLRNLSPGLEEKWKKTEGRCVCACVCVTGVQEQSLVCLQGAALLPPSRVKSIQRFLLCCPCPASR